MNAVLEYWQGLSLRERGMVGVAAAVLGVFILYGAVWRPLDNSVENYQSSLESQQRLLTWMQRSSQEAMRLRATDTRRGTGGGSLLSTVERTSRQHQLAGSLRRVEPQGDGKVRMQFEEADFDRLIRWLQILASNHAIHVDSLTADRRSEGRVNARIVLAGGEA